MGRGVRDSREGGRGVLRQASPFYSLTLAGAEGHGMGGLSQLLSLVPPPNRPIALHLPRQLNHLGSRQQRMRAHGPCTHMHGLDQVSWTMGSRPVLSHIPCPPPFSLLRTLKGQGLCRRSQDRLRKRACKHIIHFFRPPLYFRIRPNNLWRFERDCMALFQTRYCPVGMVGSHDHVARHGAQLTHQLAKLKLKLVPQSARPALSTCAFPIPASL